MAVANVLNIPRPKNIRPLAAVSQSRAPVAAPDPIEIEDEPITPSLVVQGGSGTGKSFMLGRIMQAIAPKRAILLGVENKYQQLAKFKPLLIPVGVPKDGAAVTAVRMVDELKAFVKRLKVGGYREFVEKQNVGVILLDGLMEVGDLIHAANCATISKTNSYERWEKTATDTLDFCDALRDSAGTPKAISGFDPIPIVATVGEAQLEIGGRLSYKPMLPGRVGPSRMAYKFENVWRLSTSNDPNGERLFNIHTVGDETFAAKSPAGLFPAVVSGQGVGADPNDVPDGGAMFTKLVQWYNT